MKHAISLVMPGLDPGIHAVTAQLAQTPMEWIAGTSPAMTTGERGGWGEYPSVEDSPPPGAHTRADLPTRGRYEDQRWQRSHPAA